VLIYINNSHVVTDCVNAITNKFGYDYNIVIDMRNHYEIINNGEIKFDIEYMEKRKLELLERFNKKDISKYFLVLKIGDSARVFWNDGFIHLKLDDGEYYSVNEWIIKGIIE
jgi:hypothetical protein